MTEDLTPPNNHFPERDGEFIIYRTEDGNTEVHLRIVDGTVWMTQKELAELYGITVSTVSRHLKAIYGEEDLTREATVALREIVGFEQERSVTRRVETYNLDAIMAIGYRVRGARGAQFRSWATEVLKEYLIKGFAMNDEKLKDPTGKDYFDELLERIREIRSSEARFYQQILDVVATAVDYEPDQLRTRQLFATLQNKLHFAVAGQTAAEILATRSDPSAPNMGLTTFSGKKVRKGDVTVAKNYLLEDELRTLNRLTTMFLDYAQLQAERRQEMHLKDWIAQADRFIEFNDFPVLTDSGRISQEEAKRKTQERYELFDRTRAKKLHEQQIHDQIRAMSQIESEILADRRRLNRRGE